MNFKKSDLKIEYTKGQGPGGMRKNKVHTACRITHIPTGIKAYADEREQKTSKKKALEVLTKRIEEAILEKKAVIKKAKRDEAIKDKGYIRTYDFKKGTVKNHTNGKVANLKDVLYKGRIDKLQ
jgi:peptide chain release factor 1